MRVLHFVILGSAANADLSTEYVAAVQKAFAGEMEELKQLLALDASLAGARISSKGAIVQIKQLQVLEIQDIVSARRTHCLTLDGRSEEV